VPTRFIWHANVSRATRFRIGSLPGRELNESNQAQGKKARAAAVSLRKLNSIARLKDSMSSFGCVPFFQQDELRGLNVP
jgi:hypothetical protein